MQKPEAEQVHCTNFNIQSKQEAYCNQRLGEGQNQTQPVQVRQTHSKKSKQETKNPTKREKKHEKQCMCLFILILFNVKALSSYKLSFYPLQRPLKGQN